jgi:hypothetical protein
MGDIPHQLWGVQKDYKEIYKSDPMIALRTDRTIQAGYGVLDAGTILAENLSAAGNDGKLVPYNPTSFTGAEDHPGRAYLVTNSGTTDKFVYVTMDDSYKFAVGDDLIINDNTTSAENLGAITAIDRTSEPHRAKITATAAIGGTAFTVARKAYVCVEAGDNTNNYSDAVAILEKTVDTGTGENSQGAVADVIYGNCLLYEGLLTNLDSAAKTDLSASSKGQLLMIR